MNAAMGLAALGLLDEVLAHTGRPDPRPPETPFSPQHLEQAPPRPADPAAVYEFRLRVIAPNGLTEDEAKGLMNQLSADFGGVVVGRNASLESIRTTRPRPSPYDPSIRVDPGGTKEEGLLRRPEAIAGPVVPHPCHKHWHETANR